MLTSMHDWHDVASNRFVLFSAMRKVKERGSSCLCASMMKRKDCQTLISQSAHDIGASKEGLDP
jgi:hypothetical protein